jgi:hypothetical protein
VVLAVCIALAFAFSLFLVGRIRRETPAVVGAGGSPSPPLPGSGAPGSGGMGADAAKLSR